MRVALRWLSAVGLGVALFEGLDLFPARLPAAGWITLASPFLAGAAAAGASGPRIPAQLLAAAVVPWARIGVDRAIGIFHGVALPPDFGVLVILIFGVSWTGMAAVGGGAVVLGRWAVRRAARRARPTAARRA